MSKFSSSFLAFHNNLPDYKSLKVFDCAYFPLLRSYNQHKLQFKSSQFKNPSPSWSAHNLVHKPPQESESTFSHQFTSQSTESYILPLTINLQTTNSLSINIICLQELKMVNLNPRYSLATQNLAPQSRLYFNLSGLKSWSWVNHL